MRKFEMKWTFVVVFSLLTGCSDKPSEPLYLTEWNTQLKTIKGYTFPADTIRKIAISYSDKHAVNDWDNFEDCLGEYLYEKDENFKLSKIIDWCMIEQQAKKKTVHYNTADLLSDFSVWDGSYKPLEQRIKSAMNDEGSYQHIKTTYRLVYHGAKRPHMVVRTVFSGKNRYGGVVKNTITAKIDAVTKEIYSIK